MNIATILMLPGWQDSCPGHWQNLWLKKYPSAVKVVQREWMKPQKADWVERLNAVVEEHNNEEIILVGHSLGCVLATHWAHEYGATSKAKIRGALLVSPGDVEALESNHVLKSFAPLSLTKLPFPSIVVVSSNDRWVSAERGEYFAKCWGSRYINIGPHEHISTDSGFGEWPEGEELLQSLMKVEGQ